MSSEVNLKRELPAIGEALVGSYALFPRSCHLGYRGLPSREAVNGLVGKLLGLLFPGFHQRQKLHQDNIGFYVGDQLDILHDEKMQNILI